MPRRCVNCLTGGGINHVSRLQVLSRLAMELASRVRELWLDRLGGDRGMGEFAKASMKRGVQNADVIIAVVRCSTGNCPR
jgi:hypothetical protein